MSEVVRREGEGIESLIRRFNKQVDKARIIPDCKKHESFMKPSLKRKLKRVMARSREKKRMRFEAGRD